MSKKIGEYAVHVVDESGQVHSFLPGDEPPAWAAQRMGAHCFVGGEDVFNEDGIPGPVIHRDVVLPAAHGAADSDGPPPKSGKGSGESAWRAYAELKGVDVTEAEGRDDIIDALETEGVPVE